MILIDRSIIIVHVHVPTVHFEVLKIITGNPSTPTLTLIGVVSERIGPIALSKTLVSICILMWSYIGWMLT